MSEPPIFLPDFFANEPSPRTWGNVRVTIICLAFCCFLLAQALLGFLEEPITSEVAILSTLGLAYATTLKCKNSLGCIVEHLYDHSDCGAAVGGVSTTSTTTLANNEELVVYLCSSPLWTDGLLIATPLGAAQVLSRATVEVLSGDVFVGLPPTPLLSSVAGTPTAVGVAITTLIDIDEKSEDIIGMSSQLASEARCPEVDGSGSVLPVATDAGLVCYQLRLDPTAMTITNVRSFTWLTLLDTWGGVYGFVFGLVGTAFFWIEKVSASLCCGGNNKAEASASVEPQ